MTSDLAPAEWRAAETHSRTSAEFLVSSYTDISKLAHLPAGEESVGASLRRISLDVESGTLTLGSGIAVGGPNPAFCLGHPTKKDLLYVSTVSVPPTALRRLRSGCRAAAFGVTSCRGLCC